jgi:hypothetical protein
VKRSAKMKRFKGGRDANQRIRNNPGFTCFAVSALAIGINSAILTVVDAVLLKPLTYPGADRIVQFTSQSRLYEYYDPDLSATARPVKLEVDGR